MLQNLRVPKICQTYMLSCHLMLLLVLTLQFTPCCALTPFSCCSVFSLAQLSLSVGLCSLEMAKKTIGNVAEDETPVTVQKTRGMKGGCLPQKGIRKPGT